MNQRGEDARARAAEGMTEGDGAAVDVDLSLVQTQAADDTQL